MRIFFINCAFENNLFKNMIRRILAILGRIWMVVSLLVAAVVVGLVVWISAKNEDNPSSEIAVERSHVESFTTGQISRKSSVYVLLDEVDESKLNMDLNEIASISPSVDGSFSFADKNTIVFKPKTEMACDTKYEVKIDLSEIYDDDSEVFTFSFKTLPFGLDAELSSFSVKENGAYEYEILLHTLDSESLDLLKSVVKVEQMPNQTLEWSSEGAKMHLLKIVVKPDKEDEMDISTVANSDMNLDEKVLLSVKIPNPNTLSLVKVEYLGEQSKCIEVTFNKNLDPKQSLKGLVFIEEEKDGNVKSPFVSKNKIKLYLSKNLNGVVSVFLSKDIKSEDGSILGESRVENVEITLNKPDIQFLGDGVIYPKSGKVLVPFRAVGFRGVKVRVFKIYSNNVQNVIMGQNEDLVYVGRPEVVTTFYMEGSENDLKSWRNYVIDLTDMCELNPGCMYRVELFSDFRLTAWSGASVPNVDRQEMEREDNLLLAKLNDEFNSGWYYMNDIDYCYVEDYDYRDREDPSKPSYYRYRSVGRNILASNIGLVAYAPSAEKLTVIATDIMTAKAMSDVKIEVYNRQKHLIADGNTDSDGRVDFIVDSKEGLPDYVIARIGNDLNVVSVKRGSELSTSTFNVSGEVIQKGLKGYIYGERGVWRPGDTLFLSFMLNDRENKLPENHPVTMELSNPLGQMYKRKTLNKGVCGLYSFVVPTEATVPTGSWLMNVRVGGTVFSKRLRIETVKPNRLKIDLNLAELIGKGNNNFKLHTEWLNGSKARNLKYDIDVKLNKSVTSFKNLEDYKFDDIEKERAFSQMSVDAANGSVDAEGNADVHFDILANKEAPGMLRCDVSTKVYEESGEFSSDVQSVKYSPYSRYVGIKAPDFESKGYLDTGKDHKFEVALVDESGAPESGTLDVEVVKVSWYWWWNCYEGNLDYASSEKGSVVKTLKVAVGSSGRGSFNVNLKDSDWGCYLVRVKDSEGDGHSVSAMSYFDWPYLSSPRSSDRRDNAVSLSVSTDKKEYAPGDVAKVMFPSVDGGRAIVFVCNSSGILDMRTIDCKGLNTTESIEVTKEMMPNAYVVVTLLQPYEHSKNDMPIRLYGVVPIMVSSKESRLEPEIISQNEFKPMTKCEVRVKEKNGRKMAYTLAIVDEGLLDLTRFKTPDVWAAFNAKEALGLRMWDLYGNICGAFGGRISQQFSVGGDEGLNRGKIANINRFAPVVYYKGPFVLEAGDENKHFVDIPNYNGRVRIMAVATDGEAYGSSDKSVMVRSSVMVVGTMPRQIGASEEMTVAATVFATDKSVKNVKVALNCSDNLEVVGSKEKTLSFSEPADKTVQFRVKAKAKGGKGKVRIACSSGSEKSSYETDIDIRVVPNHLTKVEYFRLNAGESRKFDMKPIGTENHKFNIELSKVKPLNLSRRASDLIAYPHGCAEQITSRGFAQLNMMDFAKLTDAQRTNVNLNVSAVIKKLSSYQAGDGGMAYWPGGGYANRWVSSYILMFLHKAENKGFFVDSEMKNRLVSYVKNSVRLWKPGCTKSETFEASYALYVLASVNKSEQGTMNRMKESVSDLSETARNLLSASYALVGQPQVAKQLMESLCSSKYSSHWCSDLHSALIAYSLLGDVKAELYAEEIRGRLVSDSWMSTADVAMSLIGMDLYYQKNKSADNMKFTVSANNSEFASVDSDTEISWNGVLPSGSFSVSNKGNGTLHLVTTLEGDVLQGNVEEMKNGLAVSVYYQMQGKSVGLDEVTQGDVIKAVVTVANISGKDLKNVSLTHVLPSGFETLSSKNDSRINYQDIRDDRVLSYIDELDKNTSATVTLELSATYSGKFYVPAITAEAMYDNKMFGSTKSGYCTVK